MSLYATAEQVRAYVGAEASVLLPKEDADLEPLILKAERDVDRQLSARLEPDETTGRKLDPEALNAAQQEALSRAVAAAVEWRTLVGEDELATHDDGIETAGSVRFGDPPRPPAPATIEELAGFAFPFRSGLAITAEDAET